MAEKKPAFPQFTTPKGVLVYPHLHAPDTKFNAKGVFQTKIRLGADESAPLRAAIDAEHARIVAVAERDLEKKKAESPANKKLQKQECKVNDPPYEETEDGDFTFNTKMAWKVTPKTGKNAGKEIELKPTLFDAHLQPIKYGTKIGSGSTARVRFSIIPYNTPQGCGVKLQLDAVQVITLKTWEGRSGAEFGFAAEEDGFSAADAPEPTGGVSESTSRDGGDDEDGDEDEVDF